MHNIDRLPPNVRSMVRDAVYRVLRDYATGGKHNSIDVVRVFLQVADILADNGIVSRLQGNTRFASLNPQPGSSILPNFDIPENIAELIRHTIWELCNQGILTPTTYVEQSGSAIFLFYPGFNKLGITSYGVQVLIDTANRIQVYDPDGYLAVFHSASPPPDYEMMRYLGECVQVFRNNHLLAAVVLLGSASERLIDVFAEYLRNALVTGGLGITWHNNYSNMSSIARRFSSLRSEIERHYNNSLVYRRDLDTIQLYLLKKLGQ